MRVRKTAEKDINYYSCEFGYNHHNYYGFICGLFLYNFRNIYGIMCIVYFVNFNILSAKRRKIQLVLSIKNTFFFFI